MSRALQQQQQQQPAPSNHESYVPVIVVLILVAILGIISVMVGRLCSGRRVLGWEYDFEGWFEKKCASCIDGRINYSRPPPQTTTTNHNNNASAETVTVAIPAEFSDEASQSEQSSQNPHSAKDS